MDSVTQLVFGAAVGEGAIGKQVGRRALLWGAVAGTLPDLDVFVPLGDVVSDFTYHRSASHSLFMLALATPLLAWLVTRIHPDTRHLFRRWMLAIYLIFVTHVLLDSLTAYGTQIFWPITELPVSLATIFIIDPLYTLPLLVGVIAALVMTRESERGHLINRYGLILSSVYLGWTLVAKTLVDSRIESALEAQQIEYRDIFTTPAPFNSLLWRAVVRDDGAYYEAYYSVSQIAEDIVISDLRMGGEPDYVFRFIVGRISNPHPVSVPPVQLEANRDLGLLGLFWERIWDPQIRISPVPTVAGQDLA